MIIPNSWRCDVTDIIPPNGYVTSDEEEDEDDDVSEEKEAHDDVIDEEKLKEKNARKAQVRIENIKKVINVTCYNFRLYYV